MREAILHTQLTCTTSTQAQWWSEANNAIAAVQASLVSILDLSPPHPRKWAPEAYCAGCSLTGLVRLLLACRKTGDFDTNLATN